MPLNTEVKGDTSSLRTMADWLGARAGNARDTSAQVAGARGDSESSWRGQAADGYRSVSTKAGQRIDTLGTDLDANAKALRTHADDRDTVNNRMNEARQVAKKGGLTVNGKLILDPGPAPATPTPLPTDRRPTPAESAANQAATHAQSAYASKVVAFQQASKITSEANNLLRTSQETFTRFAKGYVDKLPFNILDISGGLAGEVAKRSSAYVAAANAMQRGIDDAARYASKRTNPFAKLGADILEADRRGAQARELQKALDTRTARMVDKLPERMKLELQRTIISEARPKTIANPLLRGGAKVLSKLPVFGLGVTALSTGYDIHQGKDPTTSIVSNAGGFVAGSLATAGVAAAGGPIGWGVAAGALVGAGVGFVVEEWGDDIAEGVGNAAEWAGNKLADAGNAVADFFGF